MSIYSHVSRRVPAIIAYRRRHCQQNVKKLWIAKRDSKGILHDCRPRPMFKPIRWKWIERKIFSINMTNEDSTNSAPSTIFSTRWTSIVWNVIYASSLVHWLSVRQMKRLLCTTHTHQLNHLHFHGDLIIVSIFCCCCLFTSSRRRCYVTIVSATVRENVFANNNKKACQTVDSEFAHTNTHMHSRPQRISEFICSQQTTTFHHSSKM